MTDSTPKHLLLISIGPVQDFIASARRCQDLWFGSWLLSDLSRAVSAHLIGLKGVTVVFPGSPGTGNERPAVANKILARVTGEPRDAADGARAALGACLTGIFDAILGRFKGDKDVHLEIAREQVAGLIELQWAAVPLTEDYPGDWRKVEALLAARKNTRDWGPPGWRQVPAVPKSSLDGAREAVIDEAVYGAAVGSRRAGLADADLWRRFHVKGKERLSGVDLLKRWGTEDDGFWRGDDEHRSSPPFHSSSHVASSPMLTRIARIGRPADVAVARWATQLEVAGMSMADVRIRPGLTNQASVSDPLAEGAATIQPARVFAYDRGRGLDGSVFYEGRLKDVAKRYLPEIQQEPGVKALRGDLRDCLGQLGVGTPPAYFAVLLADGDKMGEAISRISSLEGQQDFGKTIDIFSLGARALIEAHAGTLIYSGGDDVLALLPLHTLLHACDALRGLWDRTVHGLTCLPKGAPHPTLSIGVGISHHLDDMADARALAASAERRAKETRNALAILLQKRSGRLISVSARWDDKPLPGRLHAWMKQLRSGELPDGVAFELEEIARSGPGKESLNAEVKSALVRRVLSRKRSHAGVDQMDAALLDRAATDPLAVANEILIARELLTAHEIAWGDLT